MVVDMNRGSKWSEWAELEIDYAWADLSGNDMGGLILFRTMQRERHSCVCMCARPVSPSPWLVCLLILLGLKWRDVFQLSAARASGISGISWSGAAVRSTSGGGVFYVQLCLSSSWIESSSREKAERGATVSLQTSSLQDLPTFLLLPCPLTVLWR